MLTIKELAELKPAPYSKLFKAKVLQVSKPRPFNTNGQQKELYHLALSDNTGVIKATLYDGSKLKTLTQGTTVMITNYIMKTDKSITITTATKVFKCAKIDVDQRYEDMAKDLINPAPKKVQSIKQIKASPTKTLTSIEGQIIRDEAVKHVNVRGQPSAVRNIFVKDNTDELEVALWRGNAETTATLHDWVQITNVVVNEPNSYHPQTFLATTQNTTISISTPPEYEAAIDIIAFTTSDNNFSILCSTGDDTTEYSVTDVIMKEIMGLPSAASLHDVEEALTLELPMTVTVTMRRNAILGLAPVADKLLDSDS